MKMMARLMDWVSRSAISPKAKWTLAFIAFTESIIVPLPPDLLLIPMALTQRKKAFYFATICTIFSVLGGAVGYYIGYHFMDYVGMPIVRFYHLSDEYVRIKEWYDTYNAWAVAAAGLTPIPYKLCTLSAGAFKVHFGIFMIASVFSRSLRFFAIAALIYVFGERARYFLEKRFDLVLIVTLVLGIAGFLVIKLL
ncbi:VTT domain-containing protein [Halodesulfovibrio sp.]|jgi:membrane protein YqaA with SNARE-associated domain|uniref:YqaA family protein n=1 Tax=Halodesulfovibrio sp. TaxID=1912772 RepID=UPI0025FF0C0C|nr:VTT domain-containing protein [Halodesulfovibrio sp.]MCT4534893.1 VTT domain-containing protein [Halodesulfovibrio sp.]MCT4627794.1 VTT domain-containing protein [Halodesulfovibrio sp.]